ncbi:cilia- and flagella-associated protein 45-like isoform X1 [Lineus longissimus]|uniref:cilia- and flagella-associated protein 45-like isoform X1 n=1 Tax=Lineus longissimus TaxID=88925 RepID=UPI002B4F1674
MPGSTYSGSSGTQTSSAARRAKSRQYRVVSNSSQVDECLFGTPNRVQQRKDMLDSKWKNDTNEETNIESEARERSANRKSNGKKKKSKKETVQVITKDLIRNLIVPSEDPSGQCIILPAPDFNRIRRAAIVVTREEREAMELQRKLEKEEADNEATRRKNFLKQMDMKRQKNEALNDLEVEAQENANHLLEKAKEQVQEQEDEIKYLNELILNAKCHAIRDAQVIEKDEIKQEMTEEEKRLDSMMEVHRVNVIRIQEEIEKQRREERLLGAATLLEQIQENERERLFELERKDQENVEGQKLIQRNIEEDRMMLEDRKIQQAHLREDLNEANADMMKRKELQMEQERLAEQKVVEYQKHKAEREAEYEKEQERARLEKEKEVGRLRAQQERMKDEQAERDALRAKRAQEQTEREWRAKEAAEAAKKAEVNAMLKVARAHQMEEKEHFLAVQAKRDRAEFERVLRAQKERVEKDKREKMEAEYKRKEHADDVRKQIREKDQVKVAERNAFFEEGVKLDMEAKVRRQKLDDIKAKKLEELRDVGIDDHYLARIARKVNIPLESVH